MVNVLEMDLTGKSPANRVVEDIKLNRQDRAFPLSKGSFYAKTLSIVNKSTQALLTLGKDYRLGELDIEAVRFTPQHEICKEIIILNTNLTDITVDYQAIGGEFQFNSVSLAAMLQEYFDTVGKTHIVNTPDQYPPSKHVQNINDFTKLGGIKNAIDRIESAIKNGKSDAFIASVLAYAEELGTALANDVKAQAEDLLDQVSFLKRRNEYRDGRYYITANGNNPGAEKGGAWALDSNVMLYGADSGSVVGEYVNVGEGEGNLATLKHLWRRSDSGELIFYSLSSSATDINEGESVEISVNVSGLPAGSLVPWRITGVDANDIVGGTIAGNFVINGSGYGSVIITIAKDRKTEGKETMRLTLVNAPTNYVSIGINDTSLTPFYRIWFSSDLAGNNVITSINEGLEGYIQLGGSDLNEGERLYLLTDDSTTNSDDFDIPLPEFMDILNGRATHKFRVRADTNTEGLETLVLNVCTTQNIGTRVARGTLQIIDSSRSPVYISKFVTDGNGSGPTITQANEGTVAYLVVEGDSLVDGTILQLQYFGQATQDDFVNTLPTFTQIIDGKAVVQYSIKNDQRTEGNEQFGINVLSGGEIVSSASLVIIDTSITLGYDIFFSSTTAGTDRISSVSEGDTCYLFLRTVGVAEGSVLKLGYGGTATAGDFDIVRPASITINGGSGYAIFPIKADRNTEGNETFTAFLQDITDRPQASISILDTSLSPVISTKFSSNDRGTDVITNTPEGRSAYLIVQTSNVNNGEVLALTYSGSVTANDFEGTRPSTVTIQNNLGVVEFKVKADALEEGTERFDVTVSYVGRPISSSLGIDIIDTSKPPRLELSVYVQGQQVTDLNNLVAYPAQNIEVRITDVNRTLSDNAIIYFNYNNKIAGTPQVPVTDVGKINGILPSQIQMSNWVARFTFTYQPDVVGTDTFTPLAFGLSAAEAAGEGAQTATFRYVGIRYKTIPLTAYWSLTDRGEPLQGQVDGARSLYYVLKAPLAVDGVLGVMMLYAGGVPASVENGALINNWGVGMQFTGGIASKKVDPNPVFYDGNKNLHAYLTNRTYNALIDGADAFITLLPPPITDVIITATPYTSGVYNGITYPIIGTINTYDYFVSKLNRVPVVGENIRFIFEANNAIVASSINEPALLFDNRFNNVNKLELNVAGIVLGRGGTGHARTALPTNGSSAIINNSSVVLNIANTGVISGGGGGGGNGYRSSNIFWNAGGGGAPFGAPGDGGTSYHQSRPGAFTAGGRGGQADAEDGNAGGAGGAWGQPGIRSRTGRREPGAAGAPFVGPITVTGSGQILGKGYTS